MHVWFTLKPWFLGLLWIPQLHAGGDNKLLWLTVFIATGVAAPLLAQLIVIQV